MKEIINEKGRKLSKNFFEIEEKIKSIGNKIIESKLESVKENFYKKNHREPDEKEINIIKKDIVMKYGMIFTLTVFALLFLLFL